MATLNQHLKEQSTAQPEKLVQVVVTVANAGGQLPATELSRQLQPIAGLAGIYTATLTGRQLLTLAQQPDIETIEADEEMRALD